MQHPLGRIEHNGLAGRTDEAPQAIGRLHPDQSGSIWRSGGNFYGCDWLGPELATVTYLEGGPDEPWPPLRWLARGVARREVRKQRLYCHPRLGAGRHIASWEPGVGAPSAWEHNSYKTYAVKFVVVA